jgi:hypothetical protein
MVGQGVSGQVSGTHKIVESQGNGICVSEQKNLLENEA